jgi:membrane-bound ClpP family serine protease
MLSYLAEALQPSSSGDPVADFAIALAMMLVAVVLVFAEILFPSFGVLTIVCVVFAVGGALMAFAIGTAWGAAYIAAAVIVFPLAVLSGIKLLKKSGMIIDTATPGSAAGGVVPEGSDLACGARGVAATLLRPAGTAVINGKRYSVVSTGDLVEKDAEVEVVSVDGLKIAVRPLRV